MKKLMYLLVVGVLFTFTACVGETEACADDCSKECCATVKCGDDCQKACCLGCKASDGDAKCKQDHSCCVANDAVDIEYPEHHNHDHDHDHSDDHNH